MRRNKLYWKLKHNLFHSYLNSFNCWLRNVFVMGRGFKLSFGNMFQNYLFHNFKWPKIQALRKVKNGPEVFALTVSFYKNHDVNDNINHTEEHIFYDYYLDSENVKTDIFANSTHFMRNRCIINAGRYWSTWRLTPL